MYWAIFGIVFFAGFAMTVREGLWSNTLTLISIFISGLIAYGFYGPLVVYLDEQVTDGQHTYWLDFAIIWALYWVAMVIMRTLFGALSKTRMRFKYPIDKVGGPIVGLMCAYLLTAFTMATLHTSPMPADAFGGVFVEKVGDQLVSRPDLVWLRLVDTETKRIAFGTGPDERWQNSMWAYEFVKNYGDHRAKFGKSADFIVKRSTNAGQ
jgi:uncharacterized membrane protein required for colicin V production